MQYKDLKEMTIKEWDGQPFKAYVCDNDDTNVDKPPTTVKVCGYIANIQYHWCCGDVRYKHAYPVEWNIDKVFEPLKPNRMTNRQLAKWLAKGNGECSYNNTVYYLNAYGYHCYDMRHANDFVNEHIRVRKWDSEEWIEPTVDLLEGL